MKPEARRRAVLHHLAAAEFGVTQGDLVALTCQPRKDIVYTINCLVADGIVSKRKVGRSVFVALERCVPEMKLHARPHRGCLLR